MAQPITPKYYADTCVLQNVSVQFKPEWDGTAWVLTPSEIIVFGKGELTETGTTVLQADIDMMATDLPAAGQTALQELYNFIETQLAAKYS